jgi:hypothetical protein
VEVLVFKRDSRTDQNFLDEPENVSIEDVESGILDVGNQRRPNGLESVVDSEPTLGE